MLVLSSFIFFLCLAVAPQTCVTWKTLAYTLKDTLTSFISNLYILQHLMCFTRQDWLTNAARYTYVEIGERCQQFLSNCTPVQPFRCVADRVLLQSLHVYEHSESAAYAYRAYVLFWGHTVSSLCLYLCCWSIKICSSLCYSLNVIHTTS